MQEKEKRQRKRKGERKDGRIQVTLQIGKTAEGKAIRKSFYGYTRAEAEQNKQAYIDAQKQGLSQELKDITVNEWVDKWIQLYEVRSADYAPYISRLKNDIGFVRVSAVSEGMLSQSLRQYKGKSKSGATKYRMIIKQVFHKAVRNHIIVFDPAEELELPQTVSGSHRALERWEIDAIIKYWDIYPAGRWAMIMLLCGLRRGEMAALQWDCIDMDARTLTVKRAAQFVKGHTVIKEQTKTAAGMRVLPICDELFFMLQETPVDKRKGFVCLSATGKQISGTIAERNWKTYCEKMTRVLNAQKCDLRGFRSDLISCKDISNKTLKTRKFEVLAHDLRHTFATMLYQSGIDVKAAQYYLGHADLRMTMNLYTHLTNEAEAEKRTAVTGYLNGYLHKNS